MKGRGSIPTAPAVHTQHLLYGRDGGEAGLKFTSSLKENYAFRRLYAKGKSAVSPYFAVYCRPTRRPYSRLGITTGVKLGKAVQRNYARRRIRELYRTCLLYTSRWTGRRWPPAGWSCPGRCPRK